MIICVQENLKKSEDRVGQSVQEKATITNSLNETLIKLQSEQSIVKDKEGRLVELQMSLESAQKILHDLKVQKESEVKSLAEQLKESRKELEQAKHGFAEQLAKLTAESVTAPKEAEASALAMTAALGKAKAESAALITSHEGKVKELESMLAQMQSKLSEANQQIATAAEKLSDLTTQHVTKIKEIETEHSLKVAEHVQHDNVTKKDFEGRTQEQTAMQSNLEKNLVVSEEKLKSSTATQISLEKSLKELKESSEEKLSKLNGEIQKLESALGSKKADLDATKANLAATTTAYSALSAQHNQLKIKTDNLTQQLEAEVSQTQERKQKVRAYVDNLNVEKREMEVMKQGLLDQLAAAGAKASQLENQIAGEEMKLKKEEIRFNTARQMAAVELEQQQQDHASKIEAKEGLFVLQVNETKRLQGLLDEHARATAEEVCTMLLSVSDYHENRHIMVNFPHVSLLCLAAISYQVSSLLYHRMIISSLRCRRHIGRWHCPVRSLSHTKRNGLLRATR